MPVKQKHTKEYLQLRKNIFPKPKTLTSEEMEEVWKRYSDLPTDDKRRMLSGIFGAMRARMTSPSTSYQFVSRLFFKEVEEMFEYIKSNPL